MKTYIDSKTIIIPLNKLRYLRNLPWLQNRKWIKANGLSLDKFEEEKQFKNEARKFKNLKNVKKFTQYKIERLNRKLEEER